MADFDIDGNAVVRGNFNVHGTTTFTGATTGIARTELDQQNEAEYVLRPETWFQTDDLDTHLGSTEAGGSAGAQGTNDLYIDTPAHGSGTPTLKTANAKKLSGITAYARRTWSVPPEYVAGQTIRLKLNVAMEGAVADQSATVDVSIFKSDEAGGVGSELITTDAQAVSSTSFAEVTFDMTCDDLSPGDELDIQLAFFVDDDATEPTVIGVIGKASMLVDRK